MVPQKNRFQNIAGVLKKASSAVLTMRIRLFVFLIMLVIMMVTVVVVILLTTGPLSAAKAEAERFAVKEFDSIRRSLSDRCGDASIQLVLLSEALSKSIEVRLADSDIRMGDLKIHPEVLEDVVGNELGRLQLALEKTKCSGVFMILDATVNPELTDAGNSRAGLCLRNVEPKLPGPDMAERYVRGFPGIAYGNGLSMTSNWGMEFDVKNRDFFHLPIGKYNETGLPLSRLTYWNLESVLSENGEGMLLCSVPLVSSSGEALGVCGFELSAVNFQSVCAPDDSEFRHIFCMLSEMDGDWLYPENALFSGNHAAFSHNKDKGSLHIAAVNGLGTYAAENGSTLMGLHEEVKLYASDSVFADRRFAVSLLIPKEELDALMARLNAQLIFICAALLVMGVVVSFFISKRYINPIIKALDAIRSDDPDAVKTNIVEIDMLVEKIKALHAKGSGLPDDLFESFIARVRTLTPTEAVVFRHYIDGRAGSEIQALMFFSQSTLKAHNRHIYSKLGVSSLDELLLYIELIKKSGLLAEIT